MSRIASSTAARAAALSAEVIDEGSVSVAVLVIAWIKTEKNRKKHDMKIRKFIFKGKSFQYFSILSEKK